MGLSENFLKRIRCKVAILLKPNDIKTWKRCLDCLTEITEVCLLKIQRKGKQTVVHFKATDENHIACLNISYRFASNTTQWQHRFAENNLCVKILADQLAAYLNALQRQKHTCIFILKHIDCVPYLHVMQFNKRGQFVQSLLAPSAENRRRQFYQVECGPQQMIQFHMKSQTFVNIVTHYALASGGHPAFQGIHLQKLSDNQLCIQWLLRSSTGTQMSIEANTQDYISTYFNERRTEFHAQYFITYLQKILSTIALCKTYDRTTFVTCKMNDEGIFIENYHVSPNQIPNKSNHQKLTFQFFLMNAQHMENNPACMV